MAPSLLPTCGSKRIQTLHWVALFSQNSQWTEHQLPETHTHKLFPKVHDLIKDMWTWQQHTPVGLHLTVEVSVTFLDGGVVGEELDICSKFFHDFKGLTRRSCRTWRHTHTDYHTVQTSDGLFIVCLGSSWPSNASPVITVKDVLYLVLHTSCQSSQSNWPPSLLCWCGVWGGWPCQSFGRWWQNKPHSGNEPHVVLKPRRTQSELNTNKN